MKRRERERDCGEIAGVYGGNERTAARGWEREEREGGRQAKPHGMPSLGHLNVLLKLPSIFLKFQFSPPKVSFSHLVTFFKFPFWP